MSNEKSCIGCKFLYQEGTGYSNYTWEGDDVKCAKDANPNLPGDRPDDWNKENDNWPKTNKSRCGLYATGVFVKLDVDGYDGPADQTQDKEAIEAICAHSGRGPHGGT